MKTGTKVEVLAQNKQGESEWLPGTVTNQATKFGRANGFVVHVSECGYVDKYIHVERGMADWFVREEKR